MATPDQGQPSGDGNDIDLIRAAVAENTRRYERLLKSHSGHARQHWSQSRQLVSDVCRELAESRKAIECGSEREAEYRRVIEAQSRANADTMAFTREVLSIVSLAAVRKWAVLGKVASAILGGGALVTLIWLLLHALGIVGAPPTLPLV